MLCPEKIAGFLVQRARIRDIAEQACRVYVNARVPLRRFNLRTGDGRETTDKREYGAIARGPCLGSDERVVGAGCIVRGGTQRLRDRARSHDQHRAVRRMHQEKRSDDGQILSANHVKENRVRLCRETRIEQSGGLVARIGAVIDQAHATQALLCEMFSQIGFSHRRHGMDAHGRVAVDAVNLAAGARRREQVAEQAVAAEIRLPADDRHERIAKMRRNVRTAAPMLPTCGALSKVEQHL